MIQMIRGQVGVAALKQALDDLDVRPGGAFIVTTPDALMEGTGSARIADPETARAAAQKVPGVKSKKFAVLRAVAAAGERGLTAEEAVAATGIEYRTLTPRIGELRRGGFVQALDGVTRLGTHGTSQQVNVVTDKGLAVVA